MKNWQFKALCRANSGIELLVTGGRHEGKRITFQHTSNSRIVGEFEDGDEANIPYGQVEFIDSEGQPKFELVTDMTGREIFPDTILCYSVTENRVHALEIGRVVSITDTGYVNMKVLVHNGMRVPPEGERASDGRWLQRERKIHDADKTLKLPADASTVMMWIMNDFEGLKDASTPR